MAVIQISKIQQRRGQKLQSGIPQLSSGELAWAVDTQELYIGNGSLLEGAPYVGNTRILTEHDNILELSSAYRFADNDVSITFSVARSLQSKLDEIQVSILDFGQGDLADGSTDCSDVFETAFAELFQNANEKYKKVLIAPNGRYLFTRTLVIPSNVILRGETRDGVILDVGANGILFASEDGSQSDFTGANRPENVSLSNLTIFSNGSETDITGLKFSVFDNVRFVSEYSLGDSVLNPVTPSVVYNITNIVDGESITITSEDFITEIEGSEGVSFPYTNSAADTAIAAAEGLNQNPKFVADFFARAQGESLVIEPRDPGNYNASNVLDLFTVILNKVEGAPDLIEGLPIEASTGVENVDAAISWTNTLFDTRVTEVLFRDCLFNDVSLAVKCLNRLPPNSESYQTNIFFERCNFVVCDTAVFVDSPRNQVNDWQFIDCRWEEVFRNAIYSTNGTGITVARPRIKNCGNGINSAVNPVYPIFVFDGESKYGNVIVDMISDRHQIAGVVNSASALAISESKNSGITALSNDHFSAITSSDSFTPVSVFSSTNRYIELDYVLMLDPGFTRKGQLIIVVNDAMNEVSISDSYVYSSDLITSPGGSLMTSFEFDAILRDNNDDSQNDTVVLLYKNPQGPTGTFSYTLIYGV